MSPSLWKLDRRTIAWICCPKGTVVRGAPSLDHHPNLGGLRKVARPIEEVLYAIEKGVLCGEGSPGGAQFGTYREGCIPAPTGPHGWLGAFVSALTTQFLAPVLSSKDSLLDLQHGEPRPEPNPLTLIDGQGNQGPLDQPQKDALDPVVSTMLKMKHEE